MIEFVFPVVSQKKFQPLANQRFLRCFAAERTLDQDGRPVAHVAGNHFIRQFRPPNVAKRCIDRVHQVQPRIDQRAVEIEDHKFDQMRIESAQGSDHLLSG